ncbi:hypothetical protein SEA_MAGRITTE_170 [Microbacterium phage Magritte]|nr:hypothetical protein SEA_MAGRITTE_170 [Microbacterium phage Magritte]
MSHMTLKHTVSPSGKTHRLTDPKTGQFVQLQYQSKPQFTDQVQGDLIRKYSREIFPVVIGQLPWRTDPELMDKGQREPSLDYLRGYLAGLEMGGQQRNRDAILGVREQIAALEAAQSPSLFPVGQSAPREKSSRERASEAVRQVRDAEDRGW